MDDFPVSSSVIPESTISASVIETEPRFKKDNVSSPVMTLIGHWGNRSGKILIAVWTLSQPNLAFAIFVTVVFESSSGKTPRNWTKPSGLRVTQNLSCPASETKEASGNNPLVGRPPVFSCEA